MRRHISTENSKHLDCLLQKRSQDSPRKFRIEYLEDGGIRLESSTSKKDFNELDVLSVNQSHTQLLLNFLDGSVVTISLPLNERKQSDLNNILNGILDAWKEYFPSYDFRSEAILVEGDDTFQLLAPDKPCEIPDIGTAVKQSSSYLCKFFKKRCNATEILECFACKEHKFLKFPDAVSHLSDDASDSAICPLLAPSFFTVLELGHVEMDEDFIHFCSIGLRTNRALRSLVLRESQIDSDTLSSLLRSIPSSSKLRKLDIASKEVEFSEVFGDLRPKIYHQLIDLRIDAGKIDNSTFMKTIAHIKSMSSEKLSLRRIVLSETCIRSPALQELTSLTPQLRELFLDQCNLGISEICFALSSSNCTLLEFLSLADNRFTKPDAVIKNYFASLRFLQRLSLNGTSGETASDVLKMIFKGLLSVENPVYNRLSVDLADCKLDTEAAEVIVKYMPKVEHLTKILLHKNAFEDKVIGIIECLPKCPRLRHISLGHKGKPVATGILEKLAETLLLPECKVEKLTLGPLGSNKELCKFLKTLANLGKKLAYLNIADCTLKDNGSKYLSGLIQWADSKTPFTLIFNSSNFSDSTWTALKELARQKGFLINQCDKSIIALQQPNVGVKRPTEVDKFIDAIITPSPELCDVDLELTHLAIRLQQKMPTTNVEKLEPHYPRIHQAKIALQDCSTLPSMHVELLDAALDPVECDRAVNQAMSDIRAVLQRTLQTFQEQSCQRLKEIVNNKSLQSFASVAKFSPQITECSLEPASRLLNQQLECSLRSMLLDANIKVAEEMLCRVTTGLKNDIETCLNDFPDQTELRPTKPAIDTGNEYQSVCPKRSYTMAGTAAESYSVENALYVSDVPPDGPKSAPLQSQGEWAPADRAPKNESTLNPPSGSPVNESKPAYDQVFSETPVPASHARPMRRKTHTVTTIIHTSDSEVVHGPVDTVDLFPTSNLPPKEAGNGSLSSSSDVQPPTPLKSPIRSSLIKAAIPGVTNDVLLNAIKKRDTSLKKSPVTPPSPPVTNYTEPSESDARKSVTALRQRFEDNSQTPRATKSMYQRRSKNLEE